MTNTSRYGLKQTMQIGVALFVLIGCANETPKSIEKVKNLKLEEIGYQLEFEEVSTEVNLSGLEFYNLFGTKTTNDTTYFFGYHDKKHKLDVFILSPGKLELSYEVPLEREGPNGTNDIQALVPLNNGDIVIIEDFGIKILNKRGKVNKSIKLLTDTYTADYQYNAPHNFQPYYSEALNTLYLKLHSLTVSDYKDPEAYFETKAFGAINLASEKGELQLDYPQSYLENYYGYMNEPNLRGDGDNIIYTFPADRKVYQFDISQNQMTIYDAEPMNISGEVPPLSWGDSDDDGKKMMHFMQSPSFQTALLFDNFIIRFYRSGLSRDQIEPGMSISKKKAYVSIFDTQNETYQDFSLPSSNLSLEKAFITPDAIWVPFFIEGQEGSMKFQKISISIAQ